MRPFSSATPALRNQESLVSLLEVLPGSKEKHVLVVQQDGHLTIFSEDLKTTTFEVSLCSNHFRDMRVLAVQSLPPAEAHRTILKQRPDVAGEEPEASYLAIAYGQPRQAGAINDLHYGVWKIDLTEKNPARDGRPFLPLFEHELALGASKSNLLKERSCTFNPKASSLFVRLGQAFLSYDVTGLVPLLASTLHTTLTGRHEIMAISSAFAICSLHETLQLYDLKYHSIQAQKDTKQAKLKRKRASMPHEGDGSGTIQFVAYFSQSSRVVGRRRHQLLAIDISAGPSRRPLETGSSLLHNIGRGISSRQATVQDQKQLLLECNTFHTESKPPSDWDSMRNRLDQSVQAGDVAGFESLFMDSVRKTAMMPASFHQTVDDLPTDCMAVPVNMINYLLSTIFRAESSTDTHGSKQHTTEKQLKIQLPTTRLILWISRLGLLSSNRVRTAIASVACNTDGPVGVQSVAEALLDTDPSCALLLDCLSNGFSPYVEEQAAVVQMLIRRARHLSSQQSSAAQSRPLANGSTDVGLPPKPPETQLQTFAASSTEKPWLPALLQNALIAALDKFGTAASSSISHNLKALFSQDEVLALTQFLRQQLFQAGYTRPLQNQAADGELAYSVKLDAAVKILSGCVDSIGPLGFCGTFDNEDFIGTIIPELATEIRNTKQSLNDASELQGVLREALRYQESIQRHQAAGSRLPAHVVGDTSPQRAGAIVTVYSEAVQGEENLLSRSALPLSLKVENVVSPVKIRKDGGQVKRRSVWQKRMLERRNRGQYSFERLVL